MFEDFFKALKERANNPIAGAFGISFVLFNWRTFSHLFLSDASVDVRLREIDALGVLIWQPIATALAYVILMPWVSLVIEWLRQFGTDELLQVKRSQGQRLNLKEKIRTEKLTLEDVLSAINPNGKKLLKDAVNEWSNNLEQYCENSQLFLKDTEVKKMQDGLVELEKAFTKFLGTPLGMYQLDQTTDQQPRQLPISE